MRELHQRCGHRVISILTSFAMAFSPLLNAIPTPAHAQPQIIIDNRGLDGHSVPHLDRTRNGIQQLDIAHPNGAGLSHNVFIQYGVEKKGLILNNATGKTSTQLGGMITGNANLEGRSANTILNEVSGHQASELLGYTEVAGPQAHVIIANPNGITCAGCGFINTNRVSLSTGRPELDASGRLQALTVTDGMIAFQAEGGDFSTVPVLDILSRRVQLNGPVNARNVSMVVGRNRVDMQTGVARRLDTGASDTPEFAIDSGAFGGMYAGQISMIVNERGAGVRVNNTLAAHAGALTITADGQLVLNGDVQARDQIALRANGMDIGGKVQAGGDLDASIVAGINNLGELSSGENHGIELTAAHLTNSGVIAAGEQAGLQIKISGQIANHGDISAQSGKVDVEAGSLYNWNDGGILARDGLALGVGGNIVNSGKFGVTVGDAHIAAGGDVQQVCGTISATAGSLDLQASRLLNGLQSYLTSGKALGLSLASLDNSGIIFSTGAQSLTVTGQAQNTGHVESLSKLDVAASALSNSGMLASSSSEINVKTSSDLTNSGTIFGAQGLSVASEGLLTNSGQIGSDAGQLVLRAGDLVNTSGKIIATSGPAQLHVADMLTNQGGMISANQGDLSVEAAALFQHGKALLAASGDISVNLGRLANDQASTIQGGHRLSLSTETSLNNAGQLSAGSSMALLAQGGLNNLGSGVISVDAGNLDIQTPDAAITNGGQIGQLQTGTTTIKAHSLDNTGLISGFDGQRLEIAQLLKNQGQLIAINGAMMVRADEITNYGQFGTSQRGELDVRARRISNSGQLSSQGEAKLQARESLKNSGQINTQSSHLVVDAGHLTNTGSFDAKSGSFALTATQGIQNSGTIYADQAMSVTTSARLDNRQGQIGSGHGDVELNAGDVDNTSGKIIASTGKLTLYAQNVTNSAGFIQGQQDVALQMRSLVNGDGGLVLSQAGDLTLKGVSGAVIESINNDAGKIGAGGDATFASQYYQSDKNSVVHAGQDLTGRVSDLLQNDGLVSAGRNMSLSIGQLSNGVTGVIAAEKGNLSLLKAEKHASERMSASVDLVNSGVIEVLGTGQTLSLLADHLDNTGKILSAGGATLHLTNVFNNAGQSAALGQGLTVSASEITNSGVLSAQDVLDLDAGISLKNRGRVIGAQGVKLSVADQIKNNAGGIIGSEFGFVTLISRMIENTASQIIAAQSQLAATATHILNDGGLIQGADVQLSADEVVNHNAAQVLASNGQLRVNGKGQSGTVTLDNAGSRLQSQNNMTLLVGKLLNAEGTIFSEQGDVALQQDTGGILQNQSGLIQAGKDLNVVSGQYQSDSKSVMRAGQNIVGQFDTTFSNAGTVLAERDVALQARDFLQTVTDPTAQSMIASNHGSVRIQAGEISNAGYIQTGQSGQTDASPDSAAAGAITLEGDTVANTGTVSSETDLSIEAIGDVTQSGVLAARNGNLGISAGSASNFGIMNSAALTTLKTDQRMTNKGHVVAGKGLIATLGTDLINDMGVVNVASGDINLTAKGEISNQGGVILSEAGKGTFDAGAINNCGGHVQVKKSLDLTSNSLNNQTGTLLSVAGNITAKNKNATGVAIDSSSGIIQGQTGLTLHTARLGNTNGQVLAMAGPLSLLGDEQTVINNAGGAIETTGALSVKAGTYSADTAGKMTSGGLADLIFTGLVDNAGQLAAQGSLGLQSNSIINRTGGVIASTEGQADIATLGAGGVTNDGTIQTTGAHQSLHLTTDNLKNGAGGGLLSNGDLYLRVADQLNNAGEITAFGSNLSAHAGTLDNQHIMIAGQSLALSTSGNLTNAGIIYGREGGDVSAFAALDNTGGQLGVDSGSLRVTAGKLDNSSGGKIINSSGAIDVNATQVNNDAGVIQSGRDMSFEIGSISNRGGQVLAQGGDLTLSGQTEGGAPVSLLRSMILQADAPVNISQLDNTGGRLQAGGSLQVLTEQLDNRDGTILTSKGDISLSSTGGMTRSLYNDGGTLQAGRDLTVRAASVSGLGSLTVTGNLILELQEGISGGQVFSTGGTATLQLGGAYNITAGGGVLAGGDAFVSAASINNGGVLLSGGALGISTAGGVDNTGLMTGTKGVTMSVAGGVNNIGGAMTSDGGSIAIGGLNGGYSGALVNRSGLIQTQTGQGDITIRAASVTNDIQGGVQFTGNSTLYDRTYTMATDQLANPPALNPSWSGYGSTNRYYNHVMKIDVPTRWRGSDGSAGRGYYLVALDGADAGSYVRITGTGSSATASGAASLIAAGGNLTLDTTGGVRNDASHLTSGGDMTITGASLTNIGYKNEIVWEITQNSPNLKRWFDPSDGTTMLDPDASAASNSAPYPGWGQFNGGPRSQIWGTSTGNALSGTIVAGANLVGNVTGDINNSTVIAHATPGQVAGNNAGPNAPSGSAQAAGRNGRAAEGTTLDVPGSGGTFAPDATGVAGGATVQSGGDHAMPSTASTDARSAGAARGGAAPQTSDTGFAPASGDTTAGTMQAPIYGGLIAPNVDAGGAATASSLNLPGFINGDDATIAGLIGTIPGGSALYISNPSPSSHVLIELNPHYTSLKAFEGSQYLLDRLGHSPSSYTFLGDDAFNQSYVQQQIVAATGKVYLGGTYQTASSQMEALLSNAADASSQLGLTLGDPLSAAQKAALKQNIVWYENATVNGQRVLVPRLYLAAGETALSGAAMGGQNVSLSGASVSNSGQITAEQNLSIVARSGDISNTGTLSGGAVQLVAQNGSIINSDTLNHYVVQGGNQQQLAGVGTVSAQGAATLSAGQDITFKGGALLAGGDVTALAGRNLTLGTTTVKQGATRKDGGATYEARQTQNYTSFVSAGGKATLAALGGDLRSQGGTILSGGDAVLSATGTLDLGSATDRQSGQVSGTRSGFLTKSHYADGFASTTENGTTVSSGGSLVLNSGHDMGIKGLVGASGNVVASAGGSIHVDATQSTYDTNHDYHKSGFALGHNGATGTIGYGSRSLKSDIQTQSWSPSVVASTGGDVTMVSGGALTLDASVVNAAGDATLSGSSVTLGTHDNVMATQGEEKRKSIGFQVGLDPGSLVGQAVNGGLAVSKSATSTLAGLSAAQSLVGGATSVVGGALQKNIVGVRNGIGFDRQSSSSSQTQTQVIGSQMVSGGRTTLLARGDNSTDASNGNLSATAAQITGRNVVLGATKDLKLEAGYDTTEQKSQANAQSAFIGASVSVGKNGYSAGLSASVSAQKQNSTSSSRTAVDTVVQAEDRVQIVAPGKTTLHGAEVSGQHIEVQTGALDIKSSQSSAKYRSTSQQGSIGATVSAVPGGASSGSVSAGYQKVENDYASTGDTLSGLYAGEGGLDVVVSGTTTLNAGVLSSTADAEKNRFKTEHLDTTAMGNRSVWSGTGASISASGSATGSSASGLGLAAVGHAAHNEHTLSHSAISGNITVEANSQNGSYARDVASANGAIKDSFNAQDVGNTLQTQMAAESLAESIGELGYQTWETYKAAEKVKAKTEAKAKKNVAERAKRKSAQKRVDGARYLYDDGVRFEIKDIDSPQQTEPLLVDRDAYLPNGEERKLRVPKFKSGRPVEAGSDRAYKASVGKTDFIWAQSKIRPPSIDFSKGMNDRELSLFIPPLAVGYGIYDTGAALYKHQWKSALINGGLVATNFIPAGKVAGTLATLRGLSNVAATGERVAVAAESGVLRSEASGAAGIAESTAGGEAKGGAEAAGEAEGSAGATAGKAGGEKEPFFDEESRTHILDGIPGTNKGGHRAGTGRANKTEFPKDWSDDTILSNVKKVIDDPKTVWGGVQGNGYQVGNGQVGDLKVRVVVDRSTGRIVSGFPTNVPRNPK